MTRVTLIQCTKTKRNDRAPAIELYDPSGYFRAMRRYAEATGNEWHILSAKHGLVHPGEELEPYDEFGLSEDQATEIANELADVETVELVAGKKYCDPLTPELEKHGIDVLEPFRGLRIGERRQQLKEKARELENNQLC